MKKEKSVVSLIISIIVIVAITAIAYAYFTAVITNNSENNVILEARSMRLTFADGEESSINTMLGVGESITKKFILTNTGVTDTYGRIMWKDLINTYMEEDLKYRLSYSTSENGTYTDLIGACPSELNCLAAENVPVSATPITTTLRGGIYIPAGVTYYFKLTIELVDWPVWPQAYDTTTRFQSSFALESAYEDESMKTMRALNLNIQNGQGDFQNIATTDETANGLFAMEDDYGTSYYFRGTAPNNYVKFGSWSAYSKNNGETTKYYYSEEECTADTEQTGTCTAINGDKAGKDMYWRIIRINGDGSVRMIYDGTKAWTSEMMESATDEEKKDRVALLSVAWNRKNEDPKFLGYMYGGENENQSSKFYQADMTHTYNGDVTTLSDEVRLSQKYYNDPYNSVYNQTDSNMKTVLEGWFETNLTEYESYLGDEIFCNDRSKSEDGRVWWSDDKMIGYWNGSNANTVTRYGGFHRLYYTFSYINYNRGVVSPNLKCQLRNDSFTMGVSKENGNDDSIGLGNGMLKYKVGGINANEVSLAGGRYYMEDSSSNNDKYFLFKQVWYWSISPAYYISPASVFRVSFSLNGYNVTQTYSGGIAPVINLSPSTVSELIGNGTIGNEFRLPE